MKQGATTDINYAFLCHYVKHSNNRNVRFTIYHKVLLLRDSNCESKRHTGFVTGIPDSQNLSCHIHIRFETANLSNCYRIV